MPEQQRQEINVTKSVNSAVVMNVYFIAESFGHSLDLNHRHSIALVNFFFFLSSCRNTVVSVNLGPLALAHLCG